MKNKSFYFFLVVGYMTLMSNSVAAMDCAIAYGISGKIYDRILVAKQKSDNPVAYAHKDDFWDIYEYSSNCKEVRTLANELIKYKLGKNDKAPVVTPPPIHPITGKSIICQKEVSKSENLDIRTITSGGKVIVNGHVVDSKLLELSNYSSNGKLIELKKYTIIEHQNNIKPFDQGHNKEVEQDFRKNKSPVLEFQGAPK